MVMARPPASKSEKNKDGKLLSHLEWPIRYGAGGHFEPAPPYLSSTAVLLHN